MSTKLINSLFLLATLVVVSCVGTIENTERESAKSAVLPPKALNYAGIEEAIPVAHSKVEVYFPPAEGNADDLTYVITYDGLIAPITVAATSLRQNHKGLLFYTVSNLLSNTTYNFKVEVKDEKQGIEGANDKMIPATTFNNQTCTFAGIQSASNLSGIAGVTGIRVDWIGGVVTGGTIPDPFDPISYEITLIDADVITADDFDTPGFVEPDKKIVIAGKDDIFKTINGLKPATRYYVRIRCIHVDYGNFGSDPTYLSEKNNIYLEISTLDNSVSSLSFDGNSVTAENPPGELGLTSLNMGWTAAQGVFDHYRVYYGPGDQVAEYNSFTPDQQCTNPAKEVFTNPTICKKVTYQELGTSLNDLLPYSEYSVLVIVCLTIECDQTGEYVKAPAQIYETTPRLVTFLGITTIDHPNDPSDLGKIYLNWELPDLQTGVADGIAIRYIDSDGVQWWLNHPAYSNDTSLEVVEFGDWRTDPRVGITGTSPLGSLSYCFQAAAYLVEANGDIRINEGAIAPPVCIDPEIMKPEGSEDWGSIEGLGPLQFKKIQVQWANDLDDRFPVSYYLVVWKATNTAGDWNWTTALDPTKVGAGDTDWPYKYHFIPTSQFEFQVGNIPCMNPGGPFFVYFGVVTYVEMLGAPIFSYQKAPLMTTITDCADI